MSATMLLEKEKLVNEKKEIPTAAKGIGTICTCGVFHMASHNAVCQACSMEKPSVK